MYNQIIHLDGIDRVGKTTLQKMLVKNTKGKYLVYDRSFISQIVYGRIFKRKINENYFFDRLVHSNLACDEKHVYLWCDKNIIAERIKSTNEKDISEDDIMGHLLMFSQVIKEARESWGCEIIEVNTSGMRPEDVYLQIQQNILNHEINYCNECTLCSREPNKKDHELGTGKLIPRINTYTPKYLIVGMNPSNKRLRFSENPFDVTTENDKNAVFINILKKYGVYEKSVITNAVKCSTETNKITPSDYNHCKHHLETELELFRPQYVIALGDNVRRLLTESNSFKDIPIIQIYHPSYQYSYNQITAEQYDDHIYCNIKFTL